MRDAEGRGMVCRFNSIERFEFNRQGREGRQAYRPDFMPCLASLAVQLIGCSK